MSLSPVPASQTPRPLGLATFLRQMSVSLPHASHGIGKAMNLPHSARRIGLPLAMQMIAILVCALVAAQLVTLALTVLLPPSPAARWNLDDVATALDAGETPERLERTTMSGPPDVSGQGWLVSESSRSALAQRLERGSDDVVLAFYTQLPVGGVAVPTNTRSPLAVAEPRLQGSGLSSFIVESAQAQSIPGGPPPGGSAAPAGLPGGNFPGGMPPGGTMPRVPHLPSATSPGGAGSRPSAMPGGAAPGGNPVGGAPAGSTGPAMGAPAAGQPTKGPAPTGQAPAGQAAPGQSASAQPGDARPGGAPFGTPGNAGASGSPAGSVSGGIGALQQAQGVQSASNGAARAPLLEGQGSGHAANLPRPTPSLALPSAPGSVPVIEAPAVPSAGGTSAGSPSADTAASTAIATATPQPIPFRRTHDSLFAMASPPFIEGDFVAAVRQGDGTWLAVAPRAEPFPNAWQMRVMAWFALSLAIISPLAWLFARRIVVPLKDFAQAAEQLGRDPSATILPLSGPAEIGRAANAFNQMRNRLRAFVDDRTAMVGAISHDLRTPLTRLRFRIEDVPDEQREGLLKEVTEMEAMISQVLAFIRDASTPGARERVDLADLVESSVADAQLVGGNVVIERNAHIPVEVDPVGIRRLLGNLLENAVKYGENARVRVSLQDGEAIAEIVDTGPGIPEEEFDRAFEPFYRTESARKSTCKGSGLGLAVCRSIARAHGGDVTFEHAKDGFVARIRVPAAFSPAPRKAA